jgi:cell division protein FtsL
MKGLKLRTVVGLFLLVLCGAGVLVAHVWKQNAYVRLSIDTVKIGKQRAQLRNDIALLEISVASLKKMSRLEGMAKSRFGLEYGKAPVLVYVESETFAKAEAEGRKAGESKPEEDMETASAETEGKGLLAGKIAWPIKGF